jgi:hypothetical protein
MMPLTHKLHDCTPTQRHDLEKDHYINYDHRNIQLTINLCHVFKVTPSIS